MEDGMKFPFAAAMSFSRLQRVVALNPQLGSNHTNHNPSHGYPLELHLSFLGDHPDLTGAIMREHRHLGFWNPTFDMKWVKTSASHDLGLSFCTPRWFRCETAIGHEQWIKSRNTHVACELFCNHNLA